MLSWSYPHTLSLVVVQPFLKFLTKAVVINPHIVSRCCSNIPEIPYKGCPDHILALSLVVVQTFLKFLTKAVLINSHIVSHCCCSTIPEIPYKGCPDQSSCFISLLFNHSLNSLQMLSWSILTLSLAVVQTFLEFLTKAVLIISSHCFSFLLKHSLNSLQRLSWSSCWGNMREGS